MFPYELSRWQCRKKGIICLELWLVTAAADFILRLTRIPTTGYQLRLILFCGLLEFRRLDTGYSWFHHTAGSSSSGWIRVVADSITSLTRIPATGYDFWLTVSCGWRQSQWLYMSYSWLQHVTNYELRLILSCGRLKIRWLDSTCGWLIL